MARDSAHPAPQYGELKPAVIEFLRELLMKAHKPAAPIGVSSKGGVSRLSIRCVNCYRTLIVPADGPMDVPWCVKDPWEKGGGSGRSPRIER